MVHDHQVAILWSFMVVTSRTRLPCSMAQVHPIYKCPTRLFTMVLRSQFSTTIAFRHLRRQRQHIHNRVRFGSSVRFLLQNTVNSDEVSIAHYIFAEVSYVSGLGLSYSLGKVFDQIGGMALMFYFPVPCCGQGFVLQ